VTSHTASLSDLVACTLYSFRAVSRDGSGNAATSTASTFLTTGCAGGTTPLSATSTAVSVSSPATATHAEASRIFTVETPEDFTATSSSVVIQIKGMESTAVLGSLGKPSAELLSAASVVFNVTALIDNETELDSFDVPVTVTFAYTDADIAGLDESTLSMYHSRDGAWTELDSCSVDQAANAITCTAPHFSIFAIFGTEPAASGGYSGTSVQGRVKNLLSSGNIAKAQDLMRSYPAAFPQAAPQAPAPVAQAPASVASAPVRDLELGFAGDDVVLLQQLLNRHGFEIAAEGPGSPGNETRYFGALTKAALMRYQEANLITPSAGYFGPMTRANLKSKGFEVWW